MARGKDKGDDDDFEQAISTRSDVFGAMALAEGLIPKFTGTDKTYTASRWIQDVEDYAEIVGWTPVQRLLMARRSLAGTAELWLRTERAFKTWDELKAGVVKEFPDAVDQKTIHEMMAARKKKASESCFEYMLIMKELGKRGKMPDYVAIKYIVQGIQDLETNKVLLYGVTTYGDLKEKLKLYEQMKENMSVQSTKVTKAHTGEKSRTERLRHTRCYNCGGREHSSADCPHKGKGAKCFRCNEFGHIAPHCKSQASSSSHSQGGNFKASTSKSTSGGASCFGNSAAAGTSDVCEQKFDSLVGMADRSSDKAGVNKQCKKSMKKVIIGNTVEVALIDSGSDVNIVSEGLYCDLGEPICEKSDIYMSGLGDKKINCLGRLKLSIVIDEQYYKDVMFYILPREAMPYRMIIGLDLLQHCVVVMESGRVSIKPVSKWTYEICVCDSVVVGNEVSVGVQQKVHQLVDSYIPKKSKEAPIALNIVLKDDTPVAQRPRRLAPREEQEVDQQVGKWLDEGIVRVSFSEYSSPVVVVKKKDGSSRVCIDYRQLNKKIIKDEYPLPIIEDHIDKLVGAKIFSTLDLKNGYFHLPVQENSIKYTSFVTSKSQYEFLKAPFGLSICPKVFTRFITIIFRDLIARGVLIIFIDDLIIPAVNEEEAVERLAEVLNVASEYGLQINWKKCQLVQRRVEYLGHIVEDGKIRPAPEKIDAVVRFPEPNDIKQLHSFVRLASYFRKYIENFAQIAKPLTDLLKKDRVFKFDDQCRQAFCELKAKLGCQPVLMIFNSSLPIELHTDASSIAYAAILFQRSGDDGHLHPVYYMSRKTSIAESKYSSYELEALAIVEAVKKFRCYLYGNHFKIVTDCKAFQMTLNKKDLAMSTRVARWILLLQEYDFEIEHRQGSRMRHVDALSRNPYVAVIRNSLHEKIRHAQSQDGELKAITEILETNRSYEDYYLENGLLYKGLQKHLVVPSPLDNDIIKKAHENGHFSKTKMLDLISKDYYIKNLGKKIEDFILTCIPCLLAEKKKGKQEGFLNPIEKEDAPFHTLHLDHIGPMTETKKKYNHILTIVDAFTKFAWIYPTKSTTSKETIEKLRTHQQCFGNPVRIITDRGAAFTSNDFEEYCNEEGITHVKITTGIPRGNGQVERTHRIIKGVLTKLCIEDPAQWYRHVSRVQRCLNSTYHRSIDTNPFELLMGTKMKSKEDCEIYNLLEQENRENFMLNRDETRRKAKEQIFKIQEENRQTYNKKRKESTKYKLGDKVAIKRTQFGVGMKLKPQFLGPYEVVKVGKNDRYEVRKADDSAEGPRTTTTSCDCMKRWPGSGME